MDKIYSLDNALASRDKDGHLVPMASLGGGDLDGKPLWFPVLSPTIGGRPDPMIFEADVAPGGRCFDAAFAPGFYPMGLGMMGHGIELPLFPGNVLFLNPCYNLPQLNRCIAANGIPPLMLAAAEQTADALAQLGITSGAGTAPLEDDTMRLRNNRGKIVPICSAHLSVLGLVKSISSTGETYEIDLSLTANGIDERFLVPEAELGNLDTFLSSRFPWFSLSEEPRAAALLEAHLRNQLKAAPNRTVFKTPGWFSLSGQHIFVHDGLPATKEFSCDCGHTILANPNLTAVQAFRSALEILDIGNLFVTLPLFLTALLGPLAAIFEAAEHPPRFCTFLNGLSGSLKTAAAEVFANYYGERDHASFRDTEAAVDVAVGTHRDRVLLMDDFQPATTASAGQCMKKTLEHILRLFGDGVAKKRSNTRATSATGTPPRGSCIITGESTSGSYSSLLRCLMVPISRGDIDGTRLRTYQENPALFTSVYSYLLPWIAENWDDLVSMIRTGFPGYRTEFGNVTPEPRLADAGAVLNLTGMIWLEFGTVCGAIDQTDYHQLLTRWEGVIRGLLTISAEASQDLDPVVLTREAITSALAAGTLSLAPNADSFQAGMGGFYTAGRLWLRKETFSKIIRSFCCEVQAACVPVKALLPELYARGLIVRDEETSKNSYLKRSPYLSALDRRLRMICFLRSELNLDD